MACHHYHQAICDPSVFILHYTEEEEEEEPGRWAGDDRRTGGGAAREIRTDSSRGGEREQGKEA